MLKSNLKKLFNISKRLKINCIKSLSLSKLSKLNFDEPSLYSSSKNSLEVVVFSKDRPLQLLALLESLKHYPSTHIRPYIIYNTQNLDYKMAYDELFTNNRDLFIEAIEDKSLGFKQTLTILLKKLSSECITFFVDDIVFKNHFDWSELLQFNTEKIVPSMRMSPGLKRCYTANDQQTLPPLKNHKKLYFWYWNEGEHDWNYPISLDGNIFSRLEFINLIDDLEFKAPNTLELKLRKHRKKFLHRLGVCFESSPIVNNPINKVQSEINNIHGKIHQDELLVLWKQGKRINFHAYENFSNISCHQELEIHLLN
jgi:hypothetical protein